MNRRSRWMPVALAVFALTLTAMVAVTAQAEQKKIEFKKVLKVEDLTDEELQKLPADQAVEYKGRRMTVGEYRAIIDDNKSIRSSEGKSPKPGQPKSIGAKGNVIRMEELSEKKLKTLPSNQVIEHQGKQLAVGEIRANQAKSKAVLERRMGESRQQARRSAEASLKELQAKLVREQKAELESQNAKVRAELAKQKKLNLDPTADGRIQAIKKEATELYNKSKNAPASEKAKLDRRAAELIVELKALGVQVKK